MHIPLQHHTIFLLSDLENIKLLSSIKLQLLILTDIPKYFCAYFLYIILFIFYGYSGYDQLQNHTPFLCQELKIINIDLK